MIHEGQGRAWSTQTVDELEGLIMKDLESFSEEERAVLFKILEEATSDPEFDFLGEGDRLIDSMTSAHYKRPLVDMHTFVYDPYYLGETCDVLYPKLYDDLVEIFQGDYNEIIFTGAIGYGKCVDGDTEVFDVSTGRRSRVRDLEALKVQSFSAEGRSRVSDATAFPSGRKPCVTLRLMSGQSLVLSTDHPVLTGRGWLPAESISVSDLVATPRSLPSPDSGPTVSDDEVKVVGYLLADGGCTGPMPTFTNMQPEVLKEYAECTERLADRARMTDPSLSSAVPVKDANSGQATTYRSRGMKWIVERYDLAHTAAGKRVPAAFYGLPEDQLALFLNRIWSCDGHLNLHNRTAEITLASERMVRDIQFLLLRLGIPSRHAPCRKTYTHLGEKRSSMAYRLSVSGRSAVLRFLERLGDIKGKESASAALRDACFSVSSVRESTNTDVVPVDKARLSAAFEELGDRGCGLKKRFALGGRHSSRSRFEAFVDATGYSGEWAWYAGSDILWERVRSVEDSGVREVFDLSVPGDHNFVANGVVIHNTFVSSIGICRVLYELSCMHDPQRALGVGADTPVSVAGFSASEDLAKEVVLKNVIGKIAASPYFAEHFPFRATQKNIRFPNNVLVVAKATTPRSALGMSPIAALIDETNFMPKRRSRKDDNRFGVVNMAKDIYDNLRRRLISRYRRQWKLFLPSSKSTRDSFLAKRIGKAKADPTVFVRDYSLWDVQPDHSMDNSFFVLCGNEQIPSKFVEDEFELKVLQENTPERTVLIEVPDDFRLDFEGDLEGGIRDFAGVATVAMSPFIHRIHKILGMKDDTREHPFTHEVLDPSKGGGVVWSKLVEKVKVRDPKGRWVTVLQPKLNPHAVRHVHIDPALNNCSAGFCMGHIAGTKRVQRRDSKLAAYPDEAPLFVVDFVLEIVPPVGGELDFALYRKLIYEFVEHGYPVRSVSMDQWQAIESLQQLDKAGFSTSQVSMDRTWDPYQNVKSALYEDRVSCYYYEPLFSQLRGLEADWERRKVTKPDGGSKDVSDALAGCLYSLLQQPVQMPIAMLKGISTHADPDAMPWMAEQQHALEAGYQAALANEELRSPSLENDPVLDFFIQSGTDIPF